MSQEDNDELMRQELLKKLEANVDLEFEDLPDDFCLKTATKTVEICVAYATAWHVYYRDEAVFDAIYDAKKQNSLAPLYENEGKVDASQMVRDAIFEDYQEFVRKLQNKQKVV